MFGLCFRLGKSPSDRSLDPTTEEQPEHFWSMTLPGQCVHIIAAILCLLPTCICACTVHFGDLFFLLEQRTGI